MMPPIPRRLLIHSAVYRHTPSRDDWGKVTWGGSVSLTYVRVEPSHALRITKDNREVRLSALLFYDCRNSLPAGLRFEVGCAVSFGGTDYTVVAEDPLYDGEKLHHLEVGLA